MVKFKLKEVEKALNKNNVVLEPKPAQPDTVSSIKEAEKVSNTNAAESSLNINPDTVIATMTSSKEGTKQLTMDDLRNIRGVDIVNHNEEAAKKETENGSLKRKRVNDGMGDDEDIVSKLEKNTAFSNGEILKMEKVSHFTY